jgi:EAL domain-containing protein (putative c-di-GMP-specific phosphodiesterase class I)
MKCDMAQGYLFGHPMTIEDLQAQVLGGTKSLARSNLG